MTPRFAAALLCLLGLTAWALPLDDAQHGFSIDVPAGFVRLPDADVPGTLHAFRREPTAELPWVLLALRAIPRTLEQGVNLDPDHHVTEAAARQGAAKTGATVKGFAYRKVTWKGFPLEVMVMRAQSPQVPAVISFSTTLPLASGALTLQAVGEEDAEASVLAAFEAAVASIKGETNWSGDLTLADARQLGERVGFVIGSVGVPLVARAASGCWRGCCFGRSGR